MSAVQTLPGSIPPMPAVARILARYDRAKLSAFIAVAIDLIDTLDGDVEAEELQLEDGFVEHDPANAGHCNADSEGGAYLEWHTRRADERRCGQEKISRHEDDEDGDNDTGVEDNPLGFDPEEDREHDGCEEESTIHPRYGIDQSLGPTSPYAA